MPESTVSYDAYRDAEQVLDRTTTCDRTGVEQPQKNGGGIAASMAENSWADAQPCLGWGAGGGEGADAQKRGAGRRA